MDGNLVSKRQTTGKKLEYPRAVLRSRPATETASPGLEKGAAVRSREH